MSEGIKLSIQRCRTMKSGVFRMLDILDKILEGCKTDSLRISSKVEKVNLCVRDNDCRSEGF